MKKQPTYFIEQYNDIQGGVTQTEWNNITHLNHYLNSTLNRNPEIYTVAIFKIYPNINPINLADMNTPTFSKISRTYPKSFSPNPEATHNSYERFQKERFGDILKGSELEPDEDEEFDLSDYQNDSNE